MKRPVHIKWDRNRPTGLGLTHDDDDDDKIGCEEVVWLEVQLLRTESGCRIQ
jgi:hypothetical protein